MKTLKHEGIIINVYPESEIMDIAQKHFDVPEGAVLDMAMLRDGKCGGWADIEGKKIDIWVMNNYCFEDLLGTVAYELGHIIEVKFEKNPPIKEEYADQHEEKAEFYEKFVMDSYSLSKKIEKEIEAIRYSHHNVWLYDCKISVRLLNCLDMAGCRTIGDVIDKDQNLGRKKWDKFRGMGKKSMYELRDFMKNEYDYKLKSV